MPIYSCECCKYNTHIKTQFERHNATTKHADMMAKPVVVKKDEPNEYEDQVNYLTEEVAELKANFAELKADNEALKASLQECKQMLLLKLQQAPIEVAPAKVEPQTIIIQQAVATPVVVPKVIDETCNPRYIEKELNSNPNYTNVPDIDCYFKIKSAHVDFNFDDIMEAEDMGEVDRRYIVDKIVDFVKTNLKKNVFMPFIYHKSSWYIKKADGWERVEDKNNKGVLSCADNYSHNIIVQKFIFIIQNRFIRHFDDATPGWRMKNDTDSVRLIAEVFGSQNYKNSEVLRPLSELFY